MITLHPDRLQAYIETALWSSRDNDTYLDDGEYELAPITKLEMRREVNQFFNLLELYIMPTGSTLLESANEYQDDEYIARDFWLTRNGHGAGFWDGYYGDLGDKLTAIAKTFSECTLYIGNDELIYQ